MFTTVRQLSSNKNKYIKNVYHKIFVKKLDSKQQYSIIPNI